MVRWAKILAGKIHTPRVLGLDLGVAGNRARFYRGKAPLPEPEELVVKIEAELALFREKR